MNKILSLESVNVSYKNTEAIQDLSFSLQSGEILGIVGESGSGKSTILKAIMGLLDIKKTEISGKILYGNKNVIKMSDSKLRQIRGKEIGMIFQNCEESLCPVRTIESQLVESFRAHEKLNKKEVLDQAIELFNKLGFYESEKLLKKYPFELSGGMNQRVAVAITMLKRPHILLADEPTSALDTIAQKKVMDELLLLRDLANASMIIVTHNIGLAAKISDSILVMKEGKSIEYGKTNQILRFPKKAYTRSLLEAVPVLRR